MWDNTAEIFRVEGGAPRAANPTGRVRVVLSPRTEPGAAASAASAATPGAGAASSAAIVPLAPSRGLGGERR